MGLDNLLSGAKDMLEKAKDLVEEKTGVDIDGIGEKLSHPESLLEKAKEAVSNPSELIEQAKEKGSELLHQAKAQLLGDDDTNTE